MTISSPAFQNYQVIPSNYTCEGEGVNPPLIFSDMPPDTKSLVLIVDDPDAPTGLFTHWVVWNISPATKEIEEDNLPPEAIEGENSMGEIGWTPPCPPFGLHHYRFQLFALSANVPCKPGASRDEVEKGMEQFVLEMAELVGQYQKEEIPGDYNPTKLL